MMMHGKLVTLLPPPPTPIFLLEWKVYIAFNVLSKFSNPQTHYKPTLNFKG